MKQNLLIIGATSGVGAALATRAASAGWDVHTRSRQTDPAWDAGKGNPLDERDLPDSIHGLVYCPGSIKLQPFHRLKPEAFEEAWRINVLGAVEVLQAMQARLKAADHAAVVLFSTVAVSQGMPFHAAIGSAKAGVEGLTKSLAAEWAPDIRVNCVAPSLMDTPLASSLVNTDAKKEAAAKRHPLARIGTADDAAGAAMFLLSQDSSWMTGQCLAVDGGMSAVRTF